MESGWQRLRWRAQIEDVHIHDLRHTVGTYAAQAGAILITLLQSILSFMQKPEFGCEIIYGVAIIGVLLLYGGERMQR